MADGKIEIETGINESGIEKGVNSITGKLNKLADNKTLGAFSKLGMAVSGVQASFQMAAKAVQITKKAINECTEAYKVQAKAEVQLQTAAKNNPLLDGASVVKLKSYASELQSISTYGDEQLLPLMAQLASAGRTEAEIMDIMNASINVAASGTMSLDEAVTNLNRTYSGQIGRLGMTIPAVKNLTEEQLKNGEATKIMKEQFGGMAESVAKATGTSQQLKNAWGDLKEEIGQPFEKAMSPLRAFFSELIGGWASAAKKRREYNEATKAIASGSAEMEDYVQGLAKAEEDLAKAQEKARKNGWGENTKSIQEAKKRIEEYTEKINELKAAEKARNEETEKANKIQEEKDKKQSAIDKYNIAVKAAEEELKSREAIGEKMSEEEKAQEMLNAKVNAYLKMLKDANGLINTDEGFGAEEAEKIKNEAEKLKAVLETTEKGNEILSKWKENLDPKEILQQQKEALENYLKLLEETGKKEEEVFAEVQTAIEKINQEIIDSGKKTFEEYASIASEFTSKFADITSGITELMTANNDKITTQEMASLDEQYSKGLISYEQYMNKKEAIDKQSAQKEYEIKMWSWHASLLEAIANTALAVAKALSSSDPVTGAIMASLVGAAGAIQVATISANKPQVPSFQTGGFLTGNSYSGDKIAFKGNAGEAILNASEQRNFMAYANGTASGGGVNMNVKVVNNRANDTSTKQEITSSGLIITIDKIVSSSMASGKYNDAMEIANNNKTGVSYL